MALVGGGLSSPWICPWDNKMEKKRKHHPVLSVHNGQNVLSAFYVSAMLTFPTPPQREVSATMGYAFWWQQTAQKSHAENDSILLLTHLNIHHSCLRTDGVTPTWDSSSCWSRGTERSGGLSSCHMPRMGEPRIICDHH